MRCHLLIVILQLELSIVHKVVSCANVFNLFSTFSSVRFSVSGFILRSLIHLQLSFVQSHRYGAACILLHADIQLYQQHLLEMLSFSDCILLASLSKIQSPLVCVFTSRSSIQLQWLTSLFLRQQHAIFINSALLCNLRTGMLMSQKFFYSTALF